MLKKIIWLVVAVIILGGAYIVYNKVQDVGELIDPLTYFDEFKTNTNNLVYRDERIALVEPVLDAKENFLAPTSLFK